MIVVTSSGGIVLRITKILFCILSFAICQAHAVIEIEITKAMDGAIPLAITSFSEELNSPLSLNIAAIIRNDLARTGEFTTSSNNTSSKTNYQLSKADMKYWLNTGVEGLVVGKIMAHDDNHYKINVKLVHLFSGFSNNNSRDHILFAKEFIVEKDQLRQFAHHVSDLVYEELTGIKGAFSTRIAYIVTKWKGDKIDEYRLEVADSDGFNPQEILSSSEPIMSPSWSPNGRQLAYVSFENFRAEIYISNIATGQRKVVSAMPGINGAPSWSPDGKNLALVLSHENVPKIYMLNLKSGRLKQLTYGRSIDTEPRFSPNGKTIFYTSNRGGYPQIYQYDLTTRKTKRITYVGNYNARAEISPDGEYLVMIHRSNQKFKIAVQELMTNKVTELTETSYDESPSLSPNGKMIIYGTRMHGKRVLGAVSLDARVKLSIPVTDGEVQEPAWSPFVSG